MYICTNADKSLIIIVTKSMRMCNAFVFKKCHSVVHKIERW